MFQLRALNPKVDQLGLGGLKLGFGLKNIRFSRHAAGVTVLCQFERLFVRRRCLIEKLRLCVNCSQLKISLRQCGLNT